MHNGLRFNPFTALACKNFRAEKCTHTSLKTVYLMACNTSTSSTVHFGTNPFTCSPDGSKSSLNGFKFESTHKGVNQRSKYVTQVQHQRPESPTITLIWHACKYKVHKLHQRYIHKSGFKFGILLVFFQVTARQSWQ